MSHVAISRGWQPSAQSSVWFWFRSCFSALWPEIKHFRIPKNCFFPVNFVVQFLGIRKCLISGHKAEKELRNQNHTEDWALGCHPRDNGHMTH